MGITRSRPAETRAGAGRAGGGRRPSLAGTGIAAALALVGASAVLAPAARAAGNGVPEACRVERPLSGRLERLDPGGVGRLADGTTFRLADVARAAARGVGLVRRAGASEAHGRAAADAAAALAEGNAAASRGEDLAAVAGALPSAVVGKTVRLHPVGNGPDRYGDVRAHVEAVGADGAAAWLQAALVAAGRAIVVPTPLASPCLAPLLALEGGARAAGRGVWGTGAVGPFEAERPDLADEAGRYAVVEGRILSTGESRRVVYLNFGNDYGTDFTVLVRKADLAAWPTAARELSRLVGRRVRTRGLVEAWNGALIRVEHPAQIEPVADGEG